MDEILNIAETFRPITLGEMDGVKLMNRIDTKFALSLEKLVEILPQLREHYHILEVAGTRVPMYESLYFDDADFSFYKDHHNGRTNRFKVRMRKYVESDLFFFEIKHKHKGRTDKKRMATDGFSQSLSEEHLAFLKKYMSEEKQLKANMWNAFNRITLVNNEAKERLTLDFNLKFYWEDDHYEFDNLVIAELKQETVNRNSAYYELMKRNRIRPYRLSKYCIGSIELYSGSLKYNRFKQKLLKLKSINDHVA